MWFRMLGEAQPDGGQLYECPICLRKFDHTEIHSLAGDHIWPYSLFGATTWENYQVICENCNLNWVSTRLRCPPPVVSYPPSKAA